MKPVVQKPRKDGFWAVYIRFTLDGRCQFGKTSKVVSSQNVKSKSEITDSCSASLCKRDFICYCPTSLFLRILRTIPIGEFTADAHKKDRMWHIRLKKKCVKIYDIRWKKCVERMDIRLKKCTFAVQNRFRIC